MDYSQIETAFDLIIKDYKTEAAQYSECCPEDLLYALEHLYNAQVHALESLKQIFISNKLYE